MILAIGAFKALHSTVQERVEEPEFSLRDSSCQLVAVVWYRQVVHSLSNKCISTVTRLVVVKQIQDPNRDHQILNVQTITQLPCSRHVTITHDAVDLTIQGNCTL